MDFPECPKRHKLVQINASGEKVGVQQCAESSCSDFGKLVNPDVCGSCLVRTAILQKAKKVAAKKPDIASMSQVAKAVPDTVSKGWKPCRHREALTIVKCCGNYKTVKRCDLEKCDHHGQEVTREICSSCPFRKP